MAQHLRDAWYKAELAGAVPPCFSRWRKRDIALVEYGCRYDQKPSGRPGMCVATRPAPVPEVFHAVDENPKISSRKFPGRRGVFRPLL